MAKRRIVVLHFVAQMPMAGIAWQALQYLVGTTAPKLAGGSAVVEQVYLLDATNRSDGDALDRSVDVLLSRIRRKLGDVEFQLIKTVRNGGYVFTAHVERVGAGK